MKQFAFVFSFLSTQEPKTLLAWFIPLFLGSEFASRCWTLLLEGKYQKSWSCQVRTPYKTLLWEKPMNAVPSSEEYSFVFACWGHFVLACSFKVSLLRFHSLLRAIRHQKCFRPSLKRMNQGLQWFSTRRSLKTFSIK